MRVIICIKQEEELQLYRRELIRLGKKHQIFVEVLLYRSGAALLFDLEDMEPYPDAVYLEIEMSRQDGIAIAHQLRSRQYHNPIIFLAENRERLHESYDVEASGYLLKEEINDAIFETVFLRVVKKTEKHNQNKVLLTNGHQQCSISLTDILYFEVDHHTVTVYYGTESFEFRMPLHKLSKLLRHKGFVRVHRSYIVAADKIIKYNYREVVLENGKVIPRGRTYVKNQITVSKERAKQVENKHNNSGKK